MRLNSIIANRHIFDGQMNGKPLQLQLAFDRGRAVRLKVASDGERMIVDDGPLDAPCNMEECGQVDIADVTEALFPTLRDVEVTGLEALAWNGCSVGVKLTLAGRDSFHFWVDGDELHWGDGAALLGHEWLDSIAPKPSERIAL
ncbi:hypothetical protein [Novosphingobium cyanobacteriorum]|uniref:Uncharacterized protein n=1 Tax=Novosphingobium cyanobacteriorum TaxID=3024215 RepID=A0ABT6CRC1_9SPHN|nr:hypothetical protein [Novosphingobium cyanobacteriorum]MDF8335087.1 hypothetical protein [Novosphingobium cyanobacteriorum]